VTYWSLIILLSFVPTIGFHSLVKSFWNSGSDFVLKITIAEMIYTMIVLPIYLTFLHFHISKRYNRNSFGVNAILILSCVLISDRMHFMNWANSVGNWEHPDSGTVALTNLELIIGFFISSIGIVISMWRLRSLKSSETSERTIG